MFAEQLLNLVRRLGGIFELAHKNPKQSQTELNHFSIKDWDSTQEGELKEYLRECRMENVLLRRPGNKQKSLSDQRLDDWVLHPCFAPYFNISTRRKKKLENLKADDLLIFFNGTDTKFSKIFSEYKKIFNSDESFSTVSQIEINLNNK